MFEEYDFVTLQVRYVPGTMKLFPAFRPDRRAAAEVTTLLADAETDRFAVAAAQQGRAQFAVGTVGREVIDALPSAPASQAPGQAVITSATSPAKGEALLVFDAPHGTGFDVLHQGPGAAGFAALAEGVLLRRFTAKGLATGSHEFKVVAHNSVGTGAQSAPAVTVGVG